MRFIDLSSDGGCSQKASPAELNALLSGVASATGLPDFQGMPDKLPDVGLFNVEGIQIVSSLDIIYPMVDSPAFFGRIVVNHVLNDIYAALSRPLFALCILGVPKGIAANDPMIVEMLSAAASGMTADFASIVGGQTLAHQANLSLGFSVVGCPLTKTHEAAAPAIGDSILLTKRLGSSIASLRWKLGEASTQEHEDVLIGMLQSNRLTAIAAAGNRVKYCTDISGFGFVNNLHALTVRACVAVQIQARTLPIYESVKPFINEDMLCTRQMLHNVDFSNDSGVARGTLSDAGNAAWYDAQTAGGLLLICPRQFELPLLEELRGNDIEVCKIGIVSDVDSQGLAFI